MSIYCSSTTKALAVCHNVDSLYETQFFKTLLLAKLIIMFIMTNDNTVFYIKIRLIYEYNKIGV